MYFAVITFLGSAENAPWRNVVTLSDGGDSSASSGNVPKDGLTGQGDGAQDQGQGGQGQGHQGQGGGGVGRLPNEQKKVNFH